MEKLYRVQFKVGDWSYSAPEQVWAYSKEEAVRKVEDHLVSFGYEDVKLESCVQLGGKL